MIKAKSFKQLLATVTVITLINACDSAPPSTPMCRISDAHQDDATGNAGCFIRLGEKIVTVGNKMTGKLDMPGGLSSNNESAQCTAHRETFEETGFNVEVGELLNVTDNGFRIYHCLLSNDLNEGIEEFPVPDWAHSEVDFIQLTDPFDTLPGQWRYPRRHLDTLSMFNKTNPKED